MAINVSNDIKSLLEVETHRYATCWIISRTSGPVLRFTDHDRPLVLADGQTYTPVAGFDSSARQKQEGLRSRNLEVIGVIDDDSIKHEDLRAGAYREAQVTEFLVDWRYPFLGHFFKNNYWINDARFGNEVWEAQLEGPTRFLRKAVGEVFGRTCRYTLYDDRCTVNESSFTVGPGTVTGFSDLLIRLKFIAGIGQPDGTFEDGEVKWLTGNNALTRSEIRSQIGGEVTLHVPAPFDIQVGDTFDLIAGCDKTTATCRDKFANLVNHGGFAFIPGTGQALQTPNTN